MTLEEGDNAEVPAGDADGNDSGAEGKSSLVEPEKKKSQKQLSKELRHTLPLRTPSASKSTKSTALTDSSCGSRTESQDPLDLAIINFIRPPDVGEEDKLLARMEKEASVERLKWELERDRERWALDKKASEGAAEQNKALVSLLSSLAPMLSAMSKKE